MLINLFVVAYSKIVSIFAVLISTKVTKLPILKAYIIYTQMENLTKQVADLQRQEETLKVELCKAIFNIVLHCPQTVEIDGLIFESPDFNPTLIRESLDTLSKIYATLKFNTNNLL